MHYPDPGIDVVEVDPTAVHSAVKSVDFSAGRAVARAVAQQPLFRLYLGGDVERA